MTAYEVWRGDDKVGDVEVDASSTIAELVSLVRREGIWDGERLGASKEDRPYGFDLRLEVCAGSTRINFVSKEYIDAGGAIDRARNNY